MKPLFTIHGGEYLFGNELELRYPTLRMWVPSKDDGIDFLVTDENTKNPLALQVKYSKDFNWSHGSPVLKPHVKSAGWYSLTKKKIVESKADYWVFVNYDGFERTIDYLFFKPSELIERFDSLGRTGDRIECYIMVTKDGNCYETRGINKSNQDEILDGSLKGTNRDLKDFFERWKVINKHFKI